MLGLARRFFSFIVRCCQIVVKNNAHHIYTARIFNNIQQLYVQLPKLRVTGSNPAFRSRKRRSREVSPPVVFRRIDGIRCP